MPYNSQKHHRRSIRLKGYDYALAGAYFVTIVAHNRESIFGEITDDAMRPNQDGEYVARWWLDIPRHFPNADIDAFVIMPNHIHGIIVIHPPVGAGSPRPAVPGSPHPVGLPRLDTGRGNRAPTATGKNTGVSNRPALGRIVAYFKYQSAKQINAGRQTPGVSVWQRSYFEHIIRSEASLIRIRRYIEMNPLQWSLDDENPDRPARLSQTR